ncbi:MAG: hypothetical protein ABJE95_04380 [Byssovorax sp.]
MGLDSRKLGYVMALFGSKSSPQPPAPSEVKVDLVEEGFLRFLLSGESNGELIKRAIDQMRVVVKGRRLRVFVLDAMAVTKVEMSMRAPGLEILALLKASGATIGVVATTSSVVRLLATTLGVASGVRIELQDTSELAMRRAHALAKGVKAG